MHLRLKIPEKAEFLYRPSRYKVLYGGRGSGKSWSIARALLVHGIAGRERILCAREIQRSIRDSSHKLLSDQITALNLGSHYTVQEQKITGKNGTEFIFAGLSTQTAETIKSAEGVTKCWVEEAQNVDKRSWDILIPTIRAEGSEIWVSFNPELESDSTYQRFIVHPPADCISEWMNYTDNPWFSPEMESARLDCLKRDPQAYPNIWEGKCLPAVAGAIYFNEVQKAESEGRIGHAPYNPGLKVHVVFDLGWNDSTAIILAQRQASAVSIIGYIEGNRRTLDDYSAELRELKYNWGRVWLPHDGFAGSVTAQPPADMLRSLGWDVAPRQDVAMMPLESGIQAARQVFGRCYFDKNRCGPLVEALKRYRRHVGKSGEESSPVHDQYSHGADAFRYLAVNVENMRNEERILPVMEAWEPLDEVVGY